MAGYKPCFTEVAPQRYKHFFLDAEHINALAAGNFYCGNIVFIDGIGNGSQLG